MQYGPIRVRIEDTVQTFAAAVCVKSVVDIVTVVIETIDIPIVVISVLFYISNKTLIFVIIILYSKSKTLKSASEIYRIYVIIVLRHSNLKKPFGKVFFLLQYQWVG